MIYDVILHIHSHEWQSLASQYLLLVLYNVQTYIKLLFMATARLSTLS